MLGPQNPLQEPIPRDQRPATTPSLVEAPPWPEVPPWEQALRSKCQRLGNQKGSRERLSVTFSSQGQKLDIHNLEEQGFLWAHFFSRGFSPWPSAPGQDGRDGRAGWRAARKSIGKAELRGRCTLPLPRRPPVTPKQVCLLTASQLQHPCNPVSTQKPHRGAWGPLGRRSGSKP